ncbi:MAG: hypothetical protein PGN26_03915, partial [Xylophilus ampelinus]
DAVHAPLLATPEAIDTWTARLLDYALAMVGAERARRAAAPAAIVPRPAAAPPAPCAPGPVPPPPARPPRNRRRTPV